MNKKILTVVGITILFLGLAVAPITQGIVTKESNNPTSSGNILYVGGTGEGNYSKIQDAIDDASDGDTVFVYAYSSPYTEDIIIEKSISLIGENRNTTVIMGWELGNIIRIYTSWVNLSGFTILNVEYGDKDALVKIGYWSQNKIKIFNNIFDASGIAAIDAYIATDITIADNIVLNQGWFILDDSWNITLRNNTFIDSYGILIANGRHVSYWDTHIIENNTINGKPIYYFKGEQDKTIPKDTSQVILANCNNCFIENLSLTESLGIQLGFSTNNKICNNTISGSIDSGIKLMEASKNTISNNIISDNKYKGISLEGDSFENIISQNIIINNTRYGIHNWYGDYNNISENYVANNEYGIYIGRLSSCDFNTITSNIVINNEKGSIILSQSDSNKVENNTIVNGGKWGICLDFLDDPNYPRNRYTSDNNDIYGNFISGHKYGIGVLLECNNNRIYHNQIDDNTYGVYLRVSDGNDIFENNLINNSKNAFFKTFRFFKIKFHHNYWDDCINGKIKIISGRKALLRYYTIIDDYRYYWFFIPWINFDWHPAKEPYDI